MGRSVVAFLHIPRIFMEYSPCKEDITRMKSLDRFDRRILNELQQAGDISMQELGERVGLSHTPCWRRVKRLEDRGLIRQRVTLLDAEQLDLAVNVFVNVSLKRHQENALSRFEEAVQDIPEVVECYSTSGLNRFPAARGSGRRERLRKAAEGNVGAFAGGWQSHLHLRAAASEIHYRLAPERLMRRKAVHWPQAVQAACGSRGNGQPHCAHRR